MLGYNNIKNNKGFSLLELIVVIAVSMVLVAFAGLTISVVHNANVSKAARSFNSLLSTARSQSISKGKDAGNLTLTMEGGRLYGEIGTYTDDAGNLHQGEKELICNGLIDVYYNELYTVVDYYDTSLTDKWADGKSYTFHFTSSGEVASNSPNPNICTLLFRKGNRTLMVVLYTETGKHEVITVN